MTRREDDTPISAEEMELAKKGEALIAAAVSETEAPHSLRESIERERVRAPAPRMPFLRRHGRLLAGAGAAVVVLVAAIAALQAGSGSDEGSAPTLAEVEAFARLEAIGPAPPKAGGDPPVLEQGVGAIQFPDWQQKFAWRAVGRRSDELSGRTVKAVYYRNPKGADLSYAIVDGAPLAESPRGQKIVHEGKTYHVANSPEHTAVTWTQQGQTCIIVASAEVPDSSLIELAASRNL